MEPFIAEIKLFGGNFAPRGWAFCNGQLLSINENSALFSLLGTTYGGDGRSTFGLPDLRGRVPVHCGFSKGPGLSNYQWGQRGGAESHILGINEIPSHNHSIAANSLSVIPQYSKTTAVNQIPQSGDVPAAAETDPSLGSATAVESFGPANDLVNGAPFPAAGNMSIGNNGGNGAHENRQPYLALNYIIALVGVFPSRS